MELSAIALGAPTIGAGRRPGMPSTAQEAAREFEALLIGQLLGAMRQAAGEREREEEVWGGSETYLEMAEQHLARMLAEGGGLGIARTILHNLKISDDKEGRGQNAR